MRFSILCLLGLGITLGGCNSVSIKPGTMEPGAKVYARYGGYGMIRSIKDSLEKHGYNVAVGKQRKDDDFGEDGAETEYFWVAIPSDAKYLVRVRERREWFRPMWCFANGFWWWNFNVSISNQKTGEELLAWRGRGCAHSSVRKLDKLLDQLERK